MTDLPVTGPWCPRDAEGFVTLQGLIFPELGISTERELYLRLEGPAGWSQSSGQIDFATGGRALFNTWFNLFNTGKWRALCALEDLHLTLWGKGRFELRIFIAHATRSWDCVVNEIVTLTPGQPLREDLSQALAEEGRKLAFFELRALEDGCVLEDAAWQTRQAPQRSPELMLSITTFRREAAVAATVRRFEAFLPQSVLASKLHMTVVDNGKSADLTTTPQVTVLLNENLGGSGGLSRGLQEARARSASHCLFMDDDAAIHMQSLERTWMLLAYTTDPATAVAGAMTQAVNRWAIWENGAVFNRSCQPQFNGLDLRNPDAAFQMEFDSTGKLPKNFYGGWWYFAFPVDQVTYDPFPFFVRGDDVSFSLANPFKIARLNGVVCFQDADFSDKESLQTLYLDLRSHMAHHLALPALELGRKGALRIPAWFFARSLVQCHYETLAALNLAFEDVMEGPRFFAENADMAERRARIGALRQDEALRDDPSDAPLKVAPEETMPAWKARLWLFSLNGHLLPFFGRFGRRVTLTTSQRGQLHPVWGARQITWRDEATGKSFTMTHSKRRAWQETRRFLRNAKRFWRDYDQIRDSWRQGYTELASQGFWTRRLGLDTVEGAVDQTSALPTDSTKATTQV